jgi:hypothetical protein
MQVVISRQRSDGSWPHVGTDDRILLNVRSERGAIAAAIDYATGRSYRIEFYDAAHPYGEPWKVLEQSSLAFPKCVDSRSEV